MDAVTENAIRAVHVSCNNDGDEYYEIGRSDVTAIEWGETNGHMAALKTVRVFVLGALHSVHPFCNVLGVYFVKPDTSMEPD